VPGSWPSRTATWAQALEGRAFWWMGQQADAAEGLVPFREKRKPDWKLSKRVDRIFLNGYVAKLQEPDQLAWFLGQHRGEELPRYELL
jgi:hypothetical protein